MKTVGLQCLALRAAEKMVSVYVVSVTADQDTLGSTAQLLTMRRRMRALQSLWLWQRASELASDIAQINARTMVSALMANACVKLAIVVLTARR